jgi:vitamin B12 transporter
MKAHIEKHLAAMLLLLAGACTTTAQTLLQGRIVNNKQEPVTAATIRLKETGTGTLSDTAGYFSMLVHEKGKRRLQVSSVGYDSREITVTLTDSTFYIDIVLTTAGNMMGEVIVVGAGSFEASDKAKGASLTPIDAVTVAGSGGDIANALRSLPGAQQIGEQEGLYVRGGTGEETKQFVDGVLLKNPNYTSVPGLVQPARLNPFLFKGILFSTGGYSALYGQAMSSALIVESVDLPDQSSASIHLFPQSTGLGFQQLGHKQKSSYGINARYANLQFYHSLVKQQPDFFHGPAYATADANFRVQTSKTGILKFYTNYGYSHTGMRNPDIDSSDLLSSFDVKGQNLYTNLSYQEVLGRGWKLQAAIACNFYKEQLATQLLNQNKELVELPVEPYREKNKQVTTRSGFAQARTVLSKGWGRSNTLRFGSEYFYTADTYNYNNSNNKLHDDLIAVFAEDDLHITRSLALRMGARAEHSTLLQRWSIAPRISMAYKIRNGEQVNLAYGEYYQKPENRWMAGNKALRFTRASHYIINYQKKAGNRLFRMEAYYKKYHNLVTTYPDTTNQGSGYAQGVELFWRDKKSIRHLDYWISYTYLDTKRRFMDYPALLRPSFSTPHTLAIAVKRYFPAINFNANLSYTIATGRPYYFIEPDANDHTALRDEGTTRAYSNMNLSFAYLFSLFPRPKHKDFSGIGFGINNVLGYRQVFGYNYSYNGLHKTAVTLPAMRSFYFGIFITLGIDRRDDFLDQNL